MFKYFIICCLLSISISASSQRTFKFKIDNQEYTTDEKTLNDLFGAAFNSLVEAKWTDVNHYQLWVDNFINWKDVVVKGTFCWDTYGDRVASTSFSGDTIPLEYLGWRAPGKSAKGNPNKPSNLSRRMQLINTFLSRQLIFYFTKKAIVN